ncbi:SHD1 domain-containing protein [Pontiella sp.]|uniref:SHD1 domain-containing protein n=1 Tax=Pontiella sp. TaxID=2837462 RepID=UPI003567CF38
MKTTKNIILAALTIATACTSAFAETRTWTDTKGKTIEAEQVKLLNDQVWLRLADGREIKVSLDSLSPEDRERAMLNQPPKLEVKVAAKVTRTNSSLREDGPASRIQVQEEAVNVAARIRKSDSTVYDAALTAELYVIGERDDHDYVVIDRTESTFAFTKESGPEHVVSSKPVTVANISDARPGVEYKGYLLVVTDSRGEIVEMKGSTGTIERDADTIVAASLTPRRAKGFDRYSAVASTRHFHQF